MPTKKKHIVIDARIRRASTGRPVARFLEHLQDIDTPYRYTVLLQPDDGWKPKAKHITTRPTRFPMFSFNILNQFLYAKQLYGLKADLVHFMQTPQQPLVYFRKFITFTHDLGMLKFARAGKLPGWLHSIRMKAYRLLLWDAHRRATWVHVPTEFVADDVNKYHLFTNRKTKVTLEASEPPLPGKAITPEQAPEEFIMYTGSAFPHKNLQKLITAFGIIKKEHPHLKLVLVGKREYHSKKLEKWAKKQAHSADIIFTGFVSDEELKWYYQHARAYVFPSLNEGFGLPGLEAMVHGCPVVSSDASCLPEVNGDAAHYFDPEDVEDIATKIDEVISSEKLRNKLIEKGYMNAKRFSWTKMTKEIVAIYDSVLA